MARRFIFSLLIIVSLWLSGLLWFIGLVPDAQPSIRGLKRTDGIIVLTGGSGRIEGALQILLKEYARKLLITGVHNQVDLQKILRSSGLVGEDREMQLGERIVAGHMAEDTKGNALEAQIWMLFEEYDSALIVTANYHLPRARYEFEQRMPDKHFEFYPVLPESFYLEDWWHYPGTAKLLISEYHKYVGTRLYGMLAVM